MPCSADACTAFQGLMQVANDPQGASHHLCVCFCASKVCDACRLVKDKNTQKLKGTAFVEYEHPEDAQRAADACAKAR